MTNSTNQTSDNIAHIREVNGQIWEIIQNQTDKHLFEVEANAALEGLCNYLKAAGWSDIEIDYLTVEISELIQTHLEKWN